MIKYSLREQGEKDLLPDCLRQKIGRTELTEEKSWITDILASFRLMEALNSITAVQVSDTRPNECSSGRATMLNQGAKAGAKRNIFINQSNKIC